MVTTLRETDWIGEILNSSGEIVQVLWGFRTGYAGLSHVFNFAFMGPVGWITIVSQDWTGRSGIVDTEAGMDVYILRFAGTVNSQLQKNFGTPPGVIIDEGDDFGPSRLYVKDKIGIQDSRMVIF